MQTLNTETNQAILAVESKLIEELNIDLNNCDHLVRFLNIAKCENALNDCVLTLYCKRVYNDFIFPMYIYLEYTNNFLSIQAMKDQLGRVLNLSCEELNELVVKGRDILAALHSDPTHKN